MAPQTWLPPLNSHNKYDVYAKASQPGRAINDPSVIYSEIAVEIKVEINFYSDKSSEQRVFRGLFTESEFTIDRDKIISDSIDGILGETFIPFDFAGAIWREKQLDSSPWDESRGCCLLRGNSDLVFKISEFLSCMKLKGFNADKNRLPFKLAIEKMVTVPDQELAAWNSWYEEKRMKDPDFERGFLEAIRRPRTYEEWIAETEVGGFRAATRASIRELESVAMDDLTSRKTDCLICLEGFSRVAEAMKLPCSHIFHRDCIVKWLQDSHMCPLCRFPLPTD